MRKKILITGGSGYIGSALYVHLRETHDVTIIDLKSPSSDIDAWKDFYNCDYDALRETHGSRLGLQNYEVIIHLAAHSTVKQCVEYPWDAFENNVEGFNTLLHKLCRDQKLIYASTGSLYTEGVGGSLASFRNMYDFSKYANDALVKLLRPKNSIGLRLGTVCGASPVMRWDTMVNGMVKSAIQNKVVRVGSPDVCRPILAMKDLCRAVGRLVVIEGEVQASPLNLASFSSSVSKIGKYISWAFGIPIEKMDNTSFYDFDMNVAAQFSDVIKEDLPDIVSDLEEILI